MEISHHGGLFGVTDIIDNQYVVRTTPYFPNKCLDQEIINSVTPIFIQTWHMRLSQLGYQNIPCLPKLADGIDVKRSNQGEICGDCMKGGQKIKPSYEPMLQPSKYLE